MTFNIDPALIVQLLFTGLTFFILLVQRIRYKVKPLNWMTAVFFLTFIRSIAEVILNPPDTGIEPFRELHFLLYAAAVLVLYFYMEFVLNDYPSTIRLVLVSFFLGGFIFFYFSAVFGRINTNPSFWLLDPDIPFYEFPFDLFQLTAFSTAFYVYLRMAFFSRSKENKRITSLLALSTFFFVIASIIELSEHFTGIEISAVITTVPGFLLLFAIYAYKPNFAFSTPVQVYRLILIHEDGQPLISIKFDPDLKFTGASSSTMLGGVTSSIGSMLNEVAGTKGEDLKRIELSNRIFQFTRHDKVISLLETSKSTRMSTRALKAFTKDFSNNFEEQIRNFMGDLSDFAGYEKILMRYFPFLNLK